MRTKVVNLFLSDSSGVEETQDISGKFQFDVRCAAGILAVNKIKGCSIFVFVMKGKD